jgi:hypothetical protein
MTGKQGGGMAILAQAEQNEIELGKWGKVGVGRRGSSGRGVGGFAANLS